MLVILATWCLAIGALVLAILYAVRRNRALGIGGRLAAIIAIAVMTFGYISAKQNMWATAVQTMIVLVALYQLRSRKYPGRQSA